MALTNFAALTQEQLTLWQRDLWKQARIHSFMNRFMGDGPNSMIQRISQLKKDQKGSRAVITLLADLVGDGVAGDRLGGARRHARRRIGALPRDGSPVSKSPPPACPGGRPGRPAGRP